jgi:DNA topoisomerase-1
MNSLIIVESPAKARTIKKFLSKGYEVKASMGHVRDLPKSQLGVDVGNHFAPKYIVIKGKHKIIKELKAAAKGSKQIFLATDPDREGEAIAWHLSEILGIEESAKRIELREITKTALLNALKQAKHLDQDKVNAQQARRVLDRLVGYKLSPLLWSKVKRGLSAGRVQSVAVKLVCEREKEIQAFVPVEYWTITAHFLKKDGSLSAFPSLLVKFKGEKLLLSDETKTQETVHALTGESYVVSSISEKDHRRNPFPPFITSTLQQDANRKLGFKVSRTMSIAQQLYEGLDIGEEGTAGLITYMRTDSTRVAEYAQKEAQEFIIQKYSEEYWLGKIFKIREGSQDAHEAIRPTSVFRTPEKVKPFLNRDQYRLYRLIWERFLASQMSSALFNVRTIEIKAGEYEFKTTGSTLKFPGFLAVYSDAGESGDAKKTDEETLGDNLEDPEKVSLPELKEGEFLNLDKLAPKQHFTQPPPRYTEASIVKTLEENGIGRPSTYAPIIETILQRRYVSLENKRFFPTPLGFVVTETLEKNFSDILNVDFTADMENKLDAVEEGKLNWVDLLSNFYPSFEGALKEAQIHLERVKVEPVVTEEICPNCGKNLVIREGRFGQFMACSGYPECRYTKGISKGTGISCPEPGCSGEILQLKTKKGRIFYGCSRYPECQFRSWNKPSSEKCPQCGSLLFEKNGKNGMTGKICAKEGCGYKSF